jgi:hypothetical protein
VQINETLVYFEFVTIPGLGALTARLAKERGTLKGIRVQGLYVTYSLASGDLEDLGWKSDGALHAKLLVFGAVDEVIRDCSYTFVC